VNKRPSLIGNKEKALIHVAKSQLGLTDEDYRAVLASVGVESSTQLNHAQFDEVMRRFKAGGFAPKAKQVPRKRRPKPAADRGPLLGKVSAILADTGLTEEYADGIARRMFGVQCVDWCNADQLWRVVAALSIYQKRKGKKEGERDDER
jgi:phage gp16-like protein